MTAMRETTSVLPLAVTGLAFEAGGKRLIDGIGFTIPAAGSPC